MLEIELEDTLHTLITDKIFCEEYSPLSLLAKDKIKYIQDMMRYLSIPFVCSHSKNKELEKEVLDLLSIPFKDVKSYVLNKGEMKTVLDTFESVLQKRITKEVLAASRQEVPIHTQTTIETETATTSPTLISIVSNDVKSSNKTYTYDDISLKTGYAKNTLSKYRSNKGADYFTQITGFKPIGYKGTTAIFQKV